MGVQKWQLKLRYQPDSLGPAQLKSLHPDSVAKIKEKDKLETIDLDNYHNLYCCNRFITPPSTHQSVAVTHSSRTGASQSLTLTWNALTTPTTPSWQRQRPRERYLRGEKKKRHHSSSKPWQRLKLNLRRRRQLCRALWLSPAAGRVQHCAASDQPVNMNTIKMNTYIHQLFIN